ncbi:VOC family protein [Aureispira]|nr:VOC family protein [Aureispira sp.]
MRKLTPFHIALPVNNLEQARKFYVNTLKCSEGRSSDTWIDFNMFGHQFVVHLSKETNQKKIIFNAVDSHNIPVPHYGVVLEWNVWEELAQHLKNHNIKFEIEPYIRFKGQPGEQATMFFYDPSGNALEFKSFKNMENLFSK